MSVRNQSTAFWAVWNIYKRHKSKKVDSCGKYFNYWFISGTSNAFILFLLKVMYIPTLLKTFHRSANLKLRSDRTNSSLKQLSLNKKALSLRFTGAI